MNMKKLMLLAAGALLMTSCGIYNKYERPEVNTIYDAPVSDCLFKGPIT